MKDKKFKWANGLLALVFTWIGVTMFFAVVVSIMHYFTGIFEQSFVVDATPEQAQVAINTSPRLAELSRGANLLVIIPLYAGFVGYSSYKGGALFEKLYKGNSPFSLDFTKMMKRISYFLIIADFIAPFVYMILLNFSKETGYHFFIDMSYPTLIGLMLYVFSVILEYGINLQEFSDQVV